LFISDTHNDWWRLNAFSFFRVQSTLTGWQTGGISITTTTLVLISPSTNRFLYRINPFYPHVRFAI